MVQTQPQGTMHYHTTHCTGVAHAQPTLLQLTDPNSTLRLPRRIVAPDTYLLTRIATHFPMPQLQPRHHYAKHDSLTTILLVTDSQQIT